MVHRGATAFWEQFNIWRVAGRNKQLGCKHTGDDAKLNNLLFHAFFFSWERAYFMPIKKSSAYLNDFLLSCRNVKLIHLVFPFLWLEALV